MSETALRVDPAPVDASFSIETQPEGLYFGLDETTYHSDKSLGSGSIRQLAKCPVYYWRDSWMNPLREDEAETPALLFGRALHCLVLEGPDEFKARYWRDVTPDDRPDALVLASDILGRLREIPVDVRNDLGIKLSGSKDVLIGYLKSYDPAAVIWDDIVTQHADAARQTGATILKPNIYGEIVQAAEYILAEPRVSAAFQNGVPEISLFWSLDGVPMKARLDYTRLGKGGVGIVTDLKSFANVMEQSPERAVGQAITKTRLDVQMAAYMDGIRRIPQWIADGKVFGADDIEPAWIEALGEVKDWRWFWCFYEKGLPVSMMRSVRVGSSLHDCGAATLSRALQAYRDNMDAFGTEWRFIDPIPDPVVDMQDLPAWHGRDE